MRRTEPPPNVKNKFEFGKLLAELPVGRLTELLGVEESSYPYWEKWKYLSEGWGLEPQKIWSIVKTLRRPRPIKFFAGPSFEMAISTPSVMQEQLHELDLGLGGSLQANGLIPENEKKYYLTSSLMEEAIASSQLEGAATTRKIARQMLESNRKPGNLSEQMIVNNYAVMQWIVGHKNISLTPELILEIHQIITASTLGDAKEEGAFREHDDIHIVDVQSGRVVHTPPGHDKLDELIREFCRFANDEIKQEFFLHPISTAICLHFLIGYIHPFADGNGRTARALFYWSLVQKGYWLIEYMSVSRILLGSKAQYSRAYLHTELDEMDLTYFVLYNLKAVEGALEDLKKYIHKKSAEKKTVLSLLRDTDFNERQLIVLQEILNDEKNMFSVNGIEQSFGVSNQTARNDLNALVELGILQRRNSGKQIQYIPVKDVVRKIRDFPNRSGLGEEFFDSK